MQSVSTYATLLSAFVTKQYDTNYYMYRGVARILEKLGQRRNFATRSGPKFFCAGSHAPLIKTTCVMGYYNVYHLIKEKHAGTSNKVQ